MSSTHEEVIAGLVKLGQRLIPSHVQVGVGHGGSGDAPHAGGAIVGHGLKGEGPQGGEVVVGHGANGGAPHDRLEGELDVVAPVEAGAGSPLPVPIVNVVLLGADREIED